MEHRLWTSNDLAIVSARKITCNALYRDGKKGMYILLSNSCLVLPAVLKQQQEETSRNHVPYLFAISVQKGK